MKNPTRLKTLALVLLSPAVFALPAAAQRTGVSHPDEVPITTSPEGIAQPVVYDANVPGAYAAPAPAAVVKPHPEAVAIAPLKPTHATLQAAVIAPTRATEAPRRNVDGDVVESVAAPANQLPAGTMLRVRMGQDLSTAGTLPGSAFSATLTHPVERDGRIVFPVGTLLTGKVTEVRGGRRISGTAMLHLMPLALVLPDGTRYALHAQVIDTGLYHSTKVDREGSILRRDHAGATLAELGLATGAGAAAGGVFGGVPGALIGGGVGAGVGTIVWLKQDRQAELPAETPVTFALTAPLTIGMQ